MNFICMECGEKLPSTFMLVYENGKQKTYCFPCKTTKEDTVDV